MTELNLIELTSGCVFLQYNVRQLPLEEVPDVSECFSLCFPSVHSFHLLSQWTCGLDHGATTVIGERSIPIYLALSHTQRLSRTGLRIDGEVIAKRESVCEGKRR